MKWTRLNIVWLFSVVSSISAAQNNANLTWWNPAKNSFNATEGQGWTGEEITTYHRLPKRVEQEVLPEIWKLSTQTAGLVIRFQTNAAQITIRYAVEGPLAMPHMPATGVSGIDLYGKDAKGNFLWCAGKYVFKDTIEYVFTNLKPVNSNATTGIEYCLYLPLYNAVKWLEVGTPDNSHFVPLPARNIKPIVVYGTSIVQGACASRPGMAWTSILSRKINLPIVNLGFSGSGRLDKEVIGLINEIDAQVFILDCLPNMAGGKASFTEAEIYTRIINAVNQIRTKHPKTPIVLTDHFGYTDAEINPVKRAGHLLANRINRQAFTALQSRGEEAISLLSMKELQQDMDTMVDGIHPTDLGMLRYAMAYLRLLQKLLAK